MQEISEKKKKRPFLVFFTSNKGEGKENGGDEAKGKRELRLTSGGETLAGRRRIKTHCRKKTKISRRQNKFINCLHRHRRVVQSGGNGGQRKRAVSGEAQTDAETLGCRQKERKRERKYKRENKEMKVKKKGYQKGK